jgi:hypothetical protein
MPAGVIALITLSIHGTVYWAEILSPKNASAGKHSSGKITKEIGGLMSKMGTLD